MARPSHAKPKPTPDRPRHLYLAAAVLSFGVFILGCIFCLTSYSDNPPLFNSGLVLFPVGIVFFFIYAIKWRNSRHTGTPPPPPAPSPEPPAPSKLPNGA